MTTSLSLGPTPSKTPALVALATWLALAAGVALSQTLTLERRAAIPVVLFSLVLAQVLLHRRGGPWRALADAIDDRALVLFHVVRLPIGAAFLWLASHGLDATFAHVAGVGDVVSGALALVVGLGFWRARRVVLAWNLLGLADILVVVFTAQRVLLFSGHPETLAPLLGFPGALLPTFLVPLVIATHVLLFARLRARAA